LASRPDRVLQFIGAAFLAEAEWDAFAAALIPAALTRGLILAGDIFKNLPTDELPRTDIRFEQALRAIASRFGQDGVAAVNLGFSQSARLNASALGDLSDQLRWLGSIDRYRDFAQQISARIVAEKPDIDRDSFVEPREMCSTTHVHDDHRLVVIESGEMVFWGTANMTVHLKPGEMVLVPQGRLHGSSVTTDNCVYHQPIIPDDWVRQVWGV
jgi:mannose-6-phosphate isomerase-like protein (cupin superfamily)